MQLYDVVIIPITNSWQNLELVKEVFFLDSVIPKCVELHLKDGSVSLVETNRIHIIKVH